MGLTASDHDRQLRRFAWLNLHDAPEGERRRWVQLLLLLGYRRDEVGVELDDAGVKA